MEEETIDNVNVEEQTTENVTPEETQETPETAQEQATQEVQSDDVDDRGVPWKNVAMELQRKQSNLQQELPSMVERIVKENTKPQQEEKPLEIRIQELEAYADVNPQHRSWVEGEKAKLVVEQNKRVVSEMLNQKDEQTRSQQIRQQTQQAVLNDPRYAQAFIDNGAGQKVINTASPLAALIDQYMGDPRIKDDPQGLLIAAKLARADLMDQGASQSTQKVQTLQRQNASLKKATLSEGGGIPVQEVATDPFTEAAAKAAKSGRMDDTQAAVKEYLKRKKK